MRHPIIQCLKRCRMGNFSITIRRINHLMISDINSIADTKTLWRNASQQNTFSINTLLVFYKIMVENFHCIKINFDTAENIFI